MIKLKVQINKNSWRQIYKLAFQYSWLWVNYLLLLCRVLTIYITIQSALILLSRAFSDGNASLALLFSSSLILNIITSCSSGRFLSCNLPYFIYPVRFCCLYAVVFYTLFLWCTFQSNPIQYFTSHSNLHNIL